MGSSDRTTGGATVRGEGGFKRPLNSFLLLMRYLYVEVRTSVFSGYLSERFSSFTMSMAFPHRSHRSLSVDAVVSMGTGASHFSQASRSASPEATTLARK